MPEWLLLVPPGEMVLGLDGRAFRSPGPNVLQAALQERGLRLPVDENHASQIGIGRAAPAYGWITEFRVDPAGLMGRVEWTARGRAAIEALDYRYYSPAFDLDFAPDPPLIRGIDSVALTNLPNLGATAALNSRGKSMDRKRLAAELGLAETATDDECLAAVRQLQAQPDGDPPTGDGAADTDTVPRADYALMSRRAATAEAALAERDASALRAEAEAAVDAAVAAAKIMPASRDYYLSHCRDREGLNAFQKFSASAPPLLQPGANAGAAGDPPAASQALPGAEDPDARSVYGQLGIDPSGGGKG